MSARVVVVGAGPAGCAAAIGLRRAGADVILVDKAQRGRDKVCGDALIPDAFAALETLGVLDAVLARAHRVATVELCAPGHAPVPLAGRLACLERAALDALLLAQAERAGAGFLPGLSFTGVQERAGRVCAVELRGGPARTVRLEADHVVLATGAAAGPLEAAGMCLRRAPSGIAVRAYFEVPEAVARDLDTLTLSYDPATCPGYGWVFPGPGGIFNVGVGLFHDAWRQPRSTNLRWLWESFFDTCPAARLVRRHGRQLTRERGAPLRTSLRGARVGRPGLLLAGEAAGSTYALTGEGIGKAMQTGLLAAECIARGDAHPEEAYARELRDRFRPRHDGYRRAQGWFSLPLVLPLLAWRAHRGRFVRSRLEALLAETGDPRQLLSVTGLVRALVA